MTPITRARLDEAARVCEQAQRDWPEVRKVLDGYATMAYVHGARYSGPSIDFDKLIALLPDLLRVVQGLLALGDVLKSSAASARHGQSRFAEGTPDHALGAGMAIAFEEAERQVRALTGEGE